MYDNQHLKENVFSVTIDSLVILTTVQEAQAPSLPVYFFNKKHPTDLPLDVVYRTSVQVNSSCF